MSTKHLVMRYGKSRTARSDLGRLIRFCLRAKLQADLHRNWFELIDRPALRTAVQASHGLCARLQHPYVSDRLAPLQRFNLLRKHFELVCAMPADIRDAIYSKAGLTIARFEEGGIEHVLKVLHQPGTEREGDLTLAWDCSLGRVAMATFVLINSRRGFRALVVGGLQGANGGDAHAMYQVLTRAMHGLRPMAALVQFLQLAAQALGVGMMLGVEDAAHAIYHPGARGSHKKALSYDAIWQEHGGKLFGHGLYQIPVRAEPRDLADVASKKRSMYRKRYALLDQVGLAMRGSLQWAETLPQPRLEAPWTPVAEHREAVQDIPDFADAFA